MTREIITENWLPEKPPFPPEKAEELELSINGRNAPIASGNTAPVLGRPGNQGHPAWFEPFPTRIRLHVYKYVEGL